MYDFDGNAPQSRVLPRRNDIKEITTDESSDNPRSTVTPPPHHHRGRAATVPVISYPKMYGKKHRVWSTQSNGIKSYIFEFSPGRFPIQSLAPRRDIDIVCSRLAFSARQMGGRSLATKHIHAYARMYIYILHPHTPPLNTPHERIILLKNGVVFRERRKKTDLAVVCHEQGGSDQTA
jgi:hypothetical protein